MSKCFFIGHRDTPAYIYPLLLIAIRKHIEEYGVDEFFVGHHGIFDSMVVQALRETKEKYPHIKNYLLLTYHPAVKKVEKPEGFDGTLLLDGQEKVPPKFAIVRLNQQILREVDYLIAYVDYITDGSYKLMDKAKARAKRGKLVITNLADPIEL